MIDSGAPSPRGSSAPRGSGVTRAIADGRAGQVAGPRPDRRRARARWSRSRQTMNVQRCMFLLLPASPAGVEDPVEMGRLERAVGEAADDPLRGDRAPDRVVVGAASGSRHGSQARGPRSSMRRVGSCSGRGARVAPGSATLGERAEPAERLLDGRERRLDVGDPRRRASPRRCPAASAGSSGPPIARARKPATTAGRRRPRRATSADRRHDQRLDPRGERVACAGRTGRRREPLQVARAARPCRSPRGRAGPDRRSGRSRVAALMSSTPVAARPDVDARREPGERIGDRVRDRQVGEPERLAGEPVRIGRCRGRDDGRDPRVGGAREDRPDGAHRVTGDRADSVTSGCSMSARNAGQRVGPELAGAERQVLGRVGPVAADVEGQAVEARRRGGRAAIGRVRSRADSQPWTRTTPGPGAPSRAGMNQAGSGSPSDSMSIDS